jgi:hypothetical protein
VIYQCVDLRRDLVQAVQPRHQYTIGLGHALHFAEKHIEIEPVQSLSKSIEIATGGVDSRVWPLGSSREDAVKQPQVAGRSHPSLSRERIVARAESGLSAACGNIPHLLFFHTLFSNPVEELVGIGRAKFRITTHLLAEMIVEFRRVHDTVVDMTRIRISS